jgi:hypothetical protein
MRDEEMARVVALQDRIDAQIRERTYQADSLADLLKTRQELNWLIEHWLEQGTLTVLVGPEGSFKSFLAVDWTMSIATGSSWHGCRVSPGRVLYIAGEGRTGVIRRMRGWCDHYEREAEGVFLGRSSVQLVLPSDTDRLAEYLNGEKWALIVIDTLARNYGPGSENDQETMNAAIASADRVREQTGACVLLVHHTPLDGRDEGKLRPRGSSALSGAADAICGCQYDKDSKVITVTSIKQKDAPNPEPLFLGFDVIGLGERDNFGNEITTVILCETQKRPVSKKALAKNQRRMIQELRTRGRGKPELFVILRDVTDTLDLSRQSRSRLEEWAREQPWMKPTTGGGYAIDMGELPDA